MAGGAIVIFRFISVQRTRRIAFVLVHDKMVLAARTIVGTILARGAIGLAGHARFVVVIFIIAIGTDLQADCQIGDMQMSRSTR